MEITISILHLILAAMVVFGACFTVWVNLNIDITKIKGQVGTLEDRDAKWEILLTGMQVDLQQIRILLASNQIKEK